jgi:murein L,D-transpeptidase YafK
MQRPRLPRRFWLLALIPLAFGRAAIGDGDEQPPLPANAVADRIVVDKARHIMTLYSHEQPLRSYAVALGRGGLDSKTREADNRTPEGQYRIDGRNPRSAFHLSLHINYPEAGDVAKAAAHGENPGGDIMIHGIRNGLGWIGSSHRWLDWTAGCIAVTNGEMEEIWRVVADGTPIEIRR